MTTLTSKPNKICFTGGGSAGHVTPNIALIEHFQDEKDPWDIHYIGSSHGIERSLIEPLSIPYHSIRTGKLRRYFSWQNFIDPFNILLGIFQAWRILYKLKPDIVFSKGGFVAFPVVFAAWLQHIPVIAHESDLTPGLANRLSFPFVKTICVTFESAKNYFSSNTKIAVTGSPIRRSIFAGNSEKGREICKFTTSRPILLVTGGGLGADRINQVIWDSLPGLLEQYQIVHLCGNGKVNDAITYDGYIQFPYLNEEYSDVLAAADCVISRAGSNSISELLSLHKPHILIPLSKQSSRGDQIINAAFFEDKGVSLVIREEELSTQKLYNTLKYIDKTKEKLLTYTTQNAVAEIQTIIKNSIKSTF